jgi:CMP-N,N'-diacetyllegionaminic acid synthase
MRIVALIPARAGSKRVPGKNTRMLGGKPLIQWTIDAAQQSGAFDSVNVCTDDEAVARSVGVTPIIWREQAADDQPDIVWVRHALEHWENPPDAFAILRPTSPFRTADTIRRAVERFKTTPCSSLRAVEPVKQHPFKTWVRHGELIEPLFTEKYCAEGDVPLHSQPTQSLRKVYVQNSSLEIAWTWCVRVFGTISGPKVAPFFTEGMEGFSIDYPDDWERAERYVAYLQATVAAE